MDTEKNEGEDNVVEDVPTEEALEETPAEEENATDTPAE